MKSLLSASLCAFLLGLAVSPVAESQSRIRPIAPNAVELESIGSMTGTIRKQVREGVSEQFGRQVESLGDVNRDGLMDWAVTRLRCDTTATGRLPQEVLVYHGTRGTLPEPLSGARIGPAEILSITDLLTIGDFDADGHRDIVMRLCVFGDTTANNTSGFDVSNLVVFWGNVRGDFSLVDTTRLCPTTQAWLDIPAAIATDFDSDGVDDLLVQSAKVGLTRGVVAPMPGLLLYRGSRGVRFGEGSVSRSASWHYWQSPESGRTKSSEARALSPVDQDCDGAVDVVFYKDDVGVAELAVLYGDKRRSLPDTASLESVRFTLCNGRASLLSDVTGDASLDLLVACGPERLLRIYPGRPGQRLLAMYGRGIDGPQSGLEWWNRPWAQIPTPDSLHDGYSSTGYTGFLPFGDVDRDGSDEIWMTSEPFILGFQGGSGLDSLADASMRMPSSQLTSVAVLGDVDGTGRRAIAVGYDVLPADPADPFPGGIRFVWGNKEIPKGYASSRLLPHIAGESCSLSAGGPSEMADPSAGAPPDVLRYSASTGMLDLRPYAFLHPRRIWMYSLLGQLTMTVSLSPEQQFLYLPPELVCSGVYLFVVKTSTRLLFAPLEIAR
jgi:hypothetical protein